MAECNYGCVDEPPYDNTIELCSGNIRGAGASFIGLVQCGVVILDPSDEVEIQAHIDAEEITMLDSVKFGMDDPSEITVDAIDSCSAPVVTNYNRTGTLSDYKVGVVNSTFYNAIKKRKYGGLLAFGCNTPGMTDLVYWVNSPITISAFMSFPNTVDQPLFYNVKASWKSLDDPGVYPAPPGITA